jgi:predicted membrane protein
VFDSNTYINKNNIVYINNTLVYIKIIMTILFLVLLISIKLIPIYLTYYFLNINNKLNMKQIKTVVKIEPDSINSKHSKYKS